MSEDIVNRLRSNQPLVICPYDRKSPEYWTTPNDTPCKFCGGLPDGPDKCTGADTRIMGVAADEITALRKRVEELEASLETGQDFANQVRAVVYKLQGQAYSSTVSALNQFDADLRRARAAIIPSDKKDG